MSNHWTSTTLYPKFSLNDIHYPLLRIDMLISNDYAHSNRAKALIKGDQTSSAYLVGLSSAITMSCNNWLKSPYTFFQSFHIRTMTPCLYHMAPLPYMGVFSNLENGFSYYLIRIYNRLHEGTIIGVIFKGGTI